MTFNFFSLYKNNARRSLAGDLMPAFLITATVLIIMAALFRLYYLTIRPMIDLKGRQSCYFYIHTGSGFSAVRDSLVKHGYLLNPKEFEWLAKRKHYPEKIRAGRYLLENGMRNNTLVNLLRSGKQEPLRITIQGLRSPEDLAGTFGRRLAVDSLQLITLFRDQTYLSRFGTTPPTLFTLFIPNTYEFFWNTSADQLFKRMSSEFERFWTPRRRYEADSLHMSISEVVTMASIIEKESNKNDEKPVIAGVYINRLKKKMPLQADPTVKFALNDFGLRRILKKHTAVKSPYNTYLNAGLPPGPICLPSIVSVDAVLQARNHAYLYFCAREDFSGYSNFAATLDEHNRNARKYQKALDARNIR